MNIDEINNVEVTKNMNPEVNSALGDYDVKQIEREVAAILDPATCPKQVELTPLQAGHIYLTRNTKNRDISAPKVGGYSRAMQRGEWLENHQGFAFYADGTLADGQHRCVAIALSGTSQKIVIFMGFVKEAIQTIDQGKPRTAGEALKMDGKHDGALKATVIKLATEYHHMIGHGVRPTYSQIQIIQGVTDADVALSSCVVKADFLLKTVTDAPMKRNDVVLHLYLMTHYGHFKQDDAAVFLGHVLTGTAPYEGAPQLALSRLLTRAKHGAKSADRLNGIARIATIQKAAKLWSENVSCSKLTWSKKEGFPLATVQTDA
jgi:hypothetical protein